MGSRKPKAAPVRHSDQWQPTKVRLSGSGRPRVPGRRGALAPGSTGVALMLARWYATMLPRYAHGTLLDLGCGEVPYYQLYRAHVREILCTDWTKSLHATTHLDFVSDLETHVPLADASVDTVILADVLEHVYQPKHVIAEIYRILRPGGVAFIHAPLLYVVHEAPHDYFRYTQFGMSRMAEEVGFTIESLTPLGGKFIALADLLGKLLQGASLIAGALWARGLQRIALAVSADPPVSKKFPIEIAAVLRRVS